MQVRRFIFFGFTTFMLGISACGPKTTVSVTQPPTPVPIAISTPSPQIATETFVSSPESTPLQLYFPKVVKYCPENRDVPITKLGLSDEYQVILSDPARTGLWKLSARGQKPVLIKRVPFNDWTSYSISPDRKRIAYTVWNKDGSSSTWVMSLKTGDEYEVVKNLTDNEIPGEISPEASAFAPEVTWKSDDEVVLFNLCRIKGCYWPLEIINVNTGDKKFYKEVDATPSEDILTYFADNNQEFFLLSSNNELYSDFYVVDFHDNHQYQVFPWLKEKVFFYPYAGTNMGLDYNSSKFGIYIKQSYGFDFAITDKRFEDISHSVPYDSIMKRVILAFDYDQSKVNWFSIDPEADLSLLNLSYTYTDLVDFQTHNVEEELMAMDYSNPINDDPISYFEFKDYCYSLKNRYWGETSPDGRIAVIGSDNNVSLINLETGYITTLPGWKFFGWAR